MNIIDVGKKINLKEKDLFLYGQYKAKITKKINSKKRGKLILVTSTNPTPYGEGKTTISIGINDILRRYGYNSVAVLREPSLGPVFGSKGGATGGGCATLIPDDDINMHFNGDFHAITSANNLLCAAIDNHIYQGNSLNIDKDKVYVHRCMDMNDRALRNIVLQNGRKEKFDITPASEVMAIFCLSRDDLDLKSRLGDIWIADSVDGKKIYARDLHVEGAMFHLLKQAFYPNLVQSKEENPIIVHGGPFANIAHGCNSIVATDLALSLADYVITEAGFGSDMGAIKFLDIKCRTNNLKPSLILINTTIRSLKYNGESLEDGISNLQFHIDNMKQFQDNVCVVLNKFESDTKEEIDYIYTFCEKQNIPFIICDSYQNGSDNKEDVALMISSLCREDEIKFPYELTDSLEEKISKLLKLHLSTTKIIYKDGVLDKIHNIKDCYPICIAKTQYSITDNPKILGYPKNHPVTITDVKVQNGAKIITIFMGDVMTMPGLSKKPNYEKFV